MKIRWLVVLVVVALTVIVSTPVVSAPGAEAARVEEATQVMREMMRMPESAIPPSLLHDAYGLAIIPNVIKGGFIFGGRHGKGVLLVHERESGWSNPCFVSITGGSVGFQMGIHSTDVVLVFKSRRSIEGLMSGKFTLGVDAAAAAGPVGRRAEASTDERLKAEIYSYSRSRGLFAGMSLEGAALQINYDANRAFYQTPGLLPSQIFAGGDVQAPPAARELRQVLTEYSQSLTTSY